jgi:predicted ATP-dependent protease
MLRDDVVRAVEAGTFHVYAVETVDQGIEILTDQPAGARDGTGRFPSGTINGLVEQRLALFARQARTYRTSPSSAESHQ